MHPLILLPFVYLFLCMMLGIKGKEKKIGFVKAFIFSIILTPITGLIMVMMSPKKYPKRIRPRSQKDEY